MIVLSQPHGVPTIEGELVRRDRIPGLETPPIQYIRGESEKLTAELLADTSDTLTDVPHRYTQPLRNLMNINADLHAPPIVRLSWGSESFKGVIESLNITFTLFTPEGTPLGPRSA